MKTDLVYLEKILDAAGQIETYTHGFSLSRFKVDRKTQSAVVLQLILIGEEAKKLSAKTKKNIMLPWKEITGFRNKAVHEYFNLDLLVVWRTVKQDIPEVRKAVKNFLN